MVRLNQVRYFGTINPKVGLVCCNEQSLKKIKGCILTIAINEAFALNDHYYEKGEESLMSQGISGTFLNTSNKQK